MKTRLFFIGLLMGSNLFSQAIVEDIGANKQLAILNKAMMGVETSNSATKSGVIKTLAEATKQTEQMYKDAQYIQEIQEELQTVSEYVKSFSSIENTVKYSIMTVESYTNIIKIITNADGFNPDDLEIVINTISPIISENRKIIDNIKKLLQNDAIKTDEGTRLNLLLSLEKDIKSNYNKMSMIERSAISMFKN